MVAASKSAPVEFSELLLAFEGLSFAYPYDDRGYIDRETGAIYVVSESAGIAEMPEGIEDPEDMEDSDRFVAIPNKNDLDLGRPLVRSFVALELPEERETVSDMFRRKGAYGRFKDWLHARGKLDAWHAFQNSATERALREWCEDNGVVISETQSHDPGDQSA